MTKIMIMGILICGGAGAIAAEPPVELANSRADARTPEAVKAADAAWLDAEIKGDYKFLEWFLLDGYESIDATGSIFSRAALIESRRRRGRSDEFAKQVRDWREQRRQIIISASAAPIHQRNQAFEERILQSERRHSHNRAC